MNGLQVLPDRATHPTCLWEDFKTKNWRQFLGFLLTGVPKINWQLPTVVRTHNLLSQDFFKSFPAVVVKSLFNFRIKLTSQQATQLQGKDWTWVWEQIENLKIAGCWPTLPAHFEEHTLLSACLFFPLFYNLPFVHLIGLPCYIWSACSHADLFSTNLAIKSYTLQIYGLARK